MFEDNLAFVAQHNNLKNSSYTLELNAFSDLTHEEFRASKLGLARVPSRRRSPGLSSTAVRDVPSSFDWRTKGAITPVKDQASCGMLIFL